MGTDVLKEQYNLLLQNQKKKIKKIQDKKSGSSSSLTKIQLPTDDFEELEKATQNEIDKLNQVDFDQDSDDDNLKIETFKKPIEPKLLKDHESTSDSLSFTDKLRELKDENGRIKKLLLEKDYEINYLKKKLDEEKQAFSGIGMGSDAIALKIVDLSKRIRELTADLEAEKTKNRKLVKLNKDLELKAKDTNKTQENDDNDEELDETNEKKLIKENKELKEKLSQTSGKMMEFKSQAEILRLDLKRAQSALEKEIGDNVDVKAILNGQSNWKGRQQQIRTLKSKLAELKQQISSTDLPEEDFESTIARLTDTHKSFDHISIASFNTSRRSNIDSKVREDIRRLEKEKREQIEKTRKEYETLEQDFNTMKSKTEAVKARNIVLTNEIKLAREQIKTLLEKGKHDDELIEALMQKQSQMKENIDNLTSKNESITKEYEEKLRETQVKGMQEKNTVDQLRAILADKEKKLKQLEDELEKLTNGETRPFNLNPLNEEIRINSSEISKRLDREIASSRHLLKSAGVVASSRLSSRPSSSNANDLVIKKEYEDLKIEFHELKTLSKSNDIERSRLMELVKTLQKRLENANERAVDFENKYNEQRRKIVSLEKQLERIKMENLASNKNQNKQKSNVLDDLKQEELETSLLIQKDENDALKAALKSTLEAKEEDLRLYVEMLESTKRVFLDGLKEFKQLTNRN